MLAPASSLLSSIREFHLPNTCQTAISKEQILKDPQENNNFNFFSEVPVEIIELIFHNCSKETLKQVSQLSVTFAKTAKRSMSIEIACLAIRTHPEIYESLHPNLSAKKDPAVVMEGLRACPSLFFSFPDSLQENKTYKEAAYFSAKVQNQMSLLQQFITQERGEEKCLRIFRDKLMKLPWDQLKKDQSLSLLLRSPPELQQDRDIVLAACSIIDGLLLHDASKESQNDREVVLAAVRRTSRALEYASKSLRDDDEIVYEAVRHAVPYSSETLRWASPRLQQNFQMVKTAVQRSGNELRYAHFSLRAHRTIVLEAVSQYGMALQFAAKKLQNDPQIVHAALQSSGEALLYVGPKLKNTPEIVLAAIKNSAFMIQHASKRLQNDFEFVKKAVQSNSRVIQFIRSDFQKSLLL